ncbi:MAG: SDR family oxidoreductase [Chloroflexi bacterium]|nr:SDR family oxidoreductase [Chloroflexota bacterium]
MKTGERRRRYRDKLSLSGKTAVVAGGGLGMGLAISQALYEAGAKVVVVDIVKERAAAAAKGLGPRATALQADVTRQADIDRLVRDVAKGHGKFELLATVVGGMQGFAPWAPVTDTDPKAWDKVLDLNLRHFFLLSRAAVTHFKKHRTRGAIVSISSVNGLTSAPHHAAYGAAKAGMISVTRTLAAECGPFGIRVNSIAPGTIMTDRSAEAYTPKALKRLNELIPLGRLGTVDDIGAVALFLLSDLSAYITGQTIVVDGGVTNVYPFSMQKAED